MQERRGRMMAKRHERNKRKKMEGINIVSQTFFKVKKPTFL